jgi:hypothetical protein
MKHLPTSAGSFLSEKVLKCLSNDPATSMMENGKSPEPNPSVAELSSRDTRCGKMLLPLQLPILQLSDAYVCQKKEGKATTCPPT